MSTIDFIFMMSKDFLGYYLSFIGDYITNHWLLITLILILIYSYETITYYKLSLKYDESKKWMAFIPVVRCKLFFDMINRSMWNILFIIFLLFVPIVGWISLIILHFVWNFEFASNFKNNIKYKLLTAFFHPVMLLIIGFNNFKYIEVV